MVKRHPIEIALDVARMPALARASVEMPIPPSIIDLMRVAAGSPSACQEAAAATGEPVPVLVEAARFYLTQSLFRPDADTYRVLGLRPDASRATAREHMRWLLQWLHPDRNTDLDVVYAHRVLKAWREISSARDVPKATRSRAAASAANGTSVPFRMPWIKHVTARPTERSRKKFRRLAIWVLPTGLVIVLVLFWSAIYLTADQTAAMIFRR